MTVADKDTSLNRLLHAADLVGYEQEIRTRLKLRNAADLQYVEEVDLSAIGMSRPEQKRLRKEYLKMFPSGFVGKLKKVFAKSESIEKKEPTRSDEEDHHVIPLEKITLCKELGQGEFGSVWQASWKTSGDVTQVAVKCVGSDRLLASSSSFLQEAAIMTRMRHDNVVRLFGVVLDTKKVMMVSELATCGSLLECLHKPALRDSFPVHSLCDYAEQIAMGMAYLESQRLIHRDLAARNVLVFSPKLVKISDFGLSRSLGIGEDYYKSEFTPTLKLPIAWCAPECINFLKFTSKSDVWAYGVTLWEMFSYGKMPWGGRSGAQILDQIDKKREHLQRPLACPEDMYDMMVETWTHQYENRPTFAEILVQFPERRAQTVRAIVDCKDVAADHLNFKKDDLIVVISRRPEAYPDGYYWFGSLRNGKLGLFRPTDTVAHLGSEAPQSNGNSLETAVTDKAEGKKKKKVDKENERERRKALISEPVGQVRHTCHVGIDGQVFGLLQLDKKDLCPQSVSPSTSRSQHSPAPSSSSGSSAVVQLRDGQARNGVLKETLSMREHISKDAVTLRQAISPPNGRAPSQPPPFLHGSQSYNMDPFQSLDRQRARGSITPTAPPESLPNSLKHPLNGISVAIEDPQTTMNSQRLSAQPRGPIAAVYARGKQIPSPRMTTDTSDLLCDEVQHLDRDLTNFSLSTIGDFSDTRPLLDAHRRQQERPPATTGIIRIADDEEMKKLEAKKQKEHLKAEKSLREARQAERSRESTIVPEDLSEEETKTYTSKLAEQPEGWSSAAQEAYKLLVECGTSLKQTSPSPTMTERVSVSPAPPRPITPPRSQRLSSPLLHSKLVTESSEESAVSYSPQKKVHIIETKLINGPARDMSPIRDRIPAFTTPMSTLPRAEKPPPCPPKPRQFPLVLDERHLAYDNLNGFGAGARAPPPVPPKPKVSFANGTLQEKASSPEVSTAHIARSSLLKNSKREEVIKF